MLPEPPSLLPQRFSSFSPKMPKDSIQMMAPTRHSNNFSNQDSYLPLMAVKRLSIFEPRTHQRDQSGQHTPLGQFKVKTVASEEEEQRKMDFLTKSGKKLRHCGSLEGLSLSKKPRRHRIFESRAITGVDESTLQKADGNSRWEEESTKRLRCKLESIIPLTTEPQLKQTMKLSGNIKGDSPFKTQLTIQHEEDKFHSHDKPTFTMSKLSTQPTPTAQSNMPKITFNFLSPVAETPSPAGSSSINFSSPATVVPDLPLHLIKKESNHRNPVTAKVKKPQVPSKKVQVGSRKSIEATVRTIRPPLDLKNSLIDLPIHTSANFDSNNSPIEGVSHKKHKQSRLSKGKRKSFGAFDCEDFVQPVDVSQETDRYFDLEEPTMEKKESYRNIDIPQEETLLKAYKPLPAEHLFIDFDRGASDLEPDEPQSQVEVKVKEVEEIVEVDTLELSSSEDLKPPAGDKVTPTAGKASRWHLLLVVLAGLLLTIQSLS